MAQVAVYTNGHDHDLQLIKVGSLARAGAGKGGVRVEEGFVGGNGHRGRRTSQRCLAVNRTYVGPPRTSDLNRNSGTRRTRRVATP